MVPCGFGINKMAVILSSTGITNITIIIYIIIALLTSTNGRPKPPRHKHGIERQHGKDLFNPKGRSRKDWLACNGLPCEEWYRIQRIMTELNLIDLNKGENPSKTVGPLSNLFGDIPSHNFVPTAAHDELTRPWEGTDILLSLEQAEELYMEALSERLGYTSRQKRKVNRDKKKRWDFPVPYKFDGSHNSQEKSAISKAMKYWANNTCIRFHEVDYRYQIEQSHLMFTRGSYGCASYVGRVNFGKYNPQPISLDSQCFNKFGIPVHEIGHALGLWHEHQRPIRDNHIFVDTRNIFFWAYSNFMSGTQDHVQNYGVPYDYNSVMHYGPTVGSRNGHATIIPKDELYKLNIGQREELSFLDIKAINMAYCQDRCRGKHPKKSCKNGGYQDPNNCDRCKCPDGLSGTDCTEVASSNGNCGGTRYLNGNDEITIETPGYSKGKHYQIGTECFWLIETKPRNRIVLTFEGDFNVMCEYESCSHWVEVKSQTDLGSPGPRFCCERRPHKKLVSDIGKMIISFKSLSKPANKDDKFIGFKAKIQLDVNGIPGVNGVPTPGIREFAQKSTTTTSIPTTTTKPTTTTTLPTTTSTLPTTTTTIPTTTTTLPTTTITLPTTTTTIPTTTTTLPTTTTTLPSTTTTLPTTTTTLPTTTTTKNVPTTTTTRTTTTTANPSTTPRSTTTERPLNTEAARRNRNNSTIRKITVFAGSNTRSRTATTTERPPTEEPEEWSEWSSCLGMDCKCGGCSWRIRYKLCGNEPCQGRNLRSEREPCDRLCSSEDTERFWVARFYTRQCKKCCSGFIPEGNKCVLKEFAHDLLPGETTKAQL